MNPPKLIHAIWFGKPIYYEYELHILRWAIKNPDFEICLYVDSAVSYHQDRFARFSNIKIIHYQSVYESLSKTEAHEDLYLNTLFLQQELNGENGNMAAASDILRLDLLYFYGGFYLDTDIDCIHPLLYFFPEKGFCCNYVDLILDGAVIEKNMILNDIMVASVKNIYVNIMRKMLHKNYIEAFHSNPDFFAARKVNGKLKQSIISTSGPGVVAQVLISIGTVDPTLNEMSTKLPSRFKKSLRQSNDNTWLDSGARSAAENNRRYDRASSIISHAFRSYMSERSSSTNDSSDSFITGSISDREDTVAITTVESQISKSKLTKMLRAMGVFFKHRRR